LEARGELYWGGTDLEGVPTLTWLIGKHLPSNQCPKRFVRFFVCQIERGLRTSPQYPNSMFNIFVELTDAGLHSIDGNVAALLQPILMKNYPKVRKGMFVFPVNWFVQLCWNTVLKPLISSLQPDIEDKICPLYGDFRPQLFARFSPDQVEVAFGGNLNLANCQPPTILAYKSLTLDAVLESQRSSKVESVSALHAAQYLASEKLQLHSEDADDILRRHRGHPVTTANGRHSAAHMKSDSFTKVKASGRGRWILFLSLVFYYCLFWHCCSWWIHCMLGVCALFFILKYKRTDLGLDFIVAGEKGDATMLPERDHGVVLRRLERERFQEPGLACTDRDAARCDDAGDLVDDGDPAAPGSAGALLEWTAGWLGDYAARCGM
jgi:hypothetical protein